MGFFKNNLIVNVVVNVLSLAIATTIPLFTYIYASPYQRGFNCDDESLMYPYKDSTIPSWLLYIVCHIIPTIIIVLNEIVLYSLLGNRPVKKKGCPLWLWNLYKYIGVYLFGFLATVTLTFIPKFAVGRLRPHFFDVCKPSVDCTDPMYQYKYIVNYTCTGSSSPELLREMRMSFPSGHSSYAAFGMIYFSGYIQLRMKFIEPFQLLRPIIQLCCITIAVYIGATRISDYKHHWSDVLLGLILGTVIACVCVRYILMLHHHQRGRFSKREAQAKPKIEEIDSSAKVATNERVTNIPLNNV